MKNLIQRFGLRVVLDVGCVLILSGFLWSIATLWVRARNGEAAFEYLQKAIASEQQRRQPSTGISAPPR